MPLTPGLSPSIRQHEGHDDVIDNDGVVVHVSDADESGEDVQKTDDEGNILQIDHPDGSITVSLAGSLGKIGQNNNPEDWFSNLAEYIEESVCNGIAEDLIRGIDDDLESRQEWVEDRALGIKLLGLKVELPGVTGGADGAPVEGMSKVRHPLLLEAVLRFQANARGEMLPTDGPVKYRNDNTFANLNEDMTANTLEKDFNHYLTSIAEEYYPDTDRMYLLLGFGGTQFKKIYYCPLRNRPVSETIDAEDLIVNNNATDLSNAKRITHRIYMRQSVVKRMQIIGAYMDVELDTPMEGKTDSLKEEKKSQQGIKPNTMRPEDRDREIYECYCELDIPGYEHRFNGKITGLELPYRVTIDVSSKRILSIVRNYNKPEKNELPQARKVFVKYTFVPGFGFYDIGLYHILGNTTNAITAAWRELLDAGMYSNFPGFLIAKTGTRQQTNILRVPPGAGAPVDTGGIPIKDAIMPLPYQPPSVALMQLVENITETGQRVGCTSELQVGEGRAEMPVGTTMALIEQATKIINSVHKRMHAAQSQEFALLAECFKEHPDTFTRFRFPSGMRWTEQTFLQALDDASLVPVADPNTASSGQRAMKVMALKQLQSANPSLYDPLAVDMAALQTIGWANPEQFLVPPTAQQQPPPELIQAQAKMANDGKKADAAAMDAQTRRMEAMAKIRQGDMGGSAGLAGGQAPDPTAEIKARTSLMDAQTRARAVDVKHADAIMQDQNRYMDRDADRDQQVMELAREIIAHSANKESNKEGSDADK